MCGFSIFETLCVEYSRLDVYWGIEFKILVNVKLNFQIKLSSEHEQIFQRRPLRGRGVIRRL